MKKQHFVFTTTILCFIVTIFSCKHNSENNDSKALDSLRFELNIYPDQIDLNENFENYIPDKSSIRPHLMEISGIVQSVKNPNSFWMHEDSGSESFIYLYSGEGKMIQKYYIKNITKYDYEDISIGIGPQGNYNHLYLGDIGDNRRVREYISIYRFPEPNYATYPNITEIYKNIESYTFIYEDGVQNCEAFFLEPSSSDLYLFTKDLGECKVYNTPFPFSTINQNILNLIGKFNIEGEKVTAADISKDGNHIVVKTYNYIFYWSREESKSLSETFQELPTRLPYNIEPQGEAFCWKDGITSYFTISESNDGNETILFEYKNSLNRLK